MKRMRRFDPKSISSL